MEAAQKVVRRVDEAHQRHPWLAFPYAVIKKFGDDQAGNLAALVSYYAFFSLFPLMLVLVTVLGIVLQRNTELGEAIQDSALANFPVIGEEISRNVRALDATGPERRRRILDAPTFEGDLIAMSAGALLAPMHAPSRPPQAPQPRLES